MPRGVAIPQLRQQLFTAAEQVIVRDGPARLNSRAVTGEARVATGLLYAHFAGFDDFLTSYAVDRTFVVSAEAAALPERAGNGQVAENLCQTMLAIPRLTLSALASLLVLKPELTHGVHAVLGERAVGIDAIEPAITDYLAAEHRLGRIRTTDPAALALALVGVLHHLVLTDSDTDTRLRRTVTALINDSAPATARGTRH